MARFLDYVEAGFLFDLIPILPPDAVMSPDSAVDPSQRGKIPGQFQVNRGCWVGMHDWTTRVFTIDDVRKWSRWPGASVGIKTKFVPTVDIDVKNDKDVEAIAGIIEMFLGWAPKRGREGSPRIAMPYLLADGETPCPKIRIAFRQPGDSETQAVELLGDGQQFVVEGIHPSGVPYEWDFDLVTVTRKNLTQITSDDWRFASTAIQSYLQSRGYEFTTREGGAAGEDQPIGHPPHVAADKDEAIAALISLPISELGYDSFISVLHAYKASVAGDEEYFKPFVDWAMQHPQAQTEDWLRAKWDSVSGSAIGKDWLFGEARKHNWVGGLDELPEIPRTVEEHRADTRVKEQVARRHAEDARRMTLTRIRVEDGRLNENVVEAERALNEASAWLPVYQHAERIVEPCEMPMERRKGKPITALQLKSPNSDRMEGIFEQVATFEVEKKGAWVRAKKCPPEVAKRYLSMAGHWTLPVLSGITATPILRPNGTVYDVPGYDSDTGLLYRPNGEVKLSVPARATKDDGARWLKVIKDELIPYFPFQAEMDRGVALSHFLTRVAMTFLPHAPAHLFSGTQAGAGKGLLVEMGSALIHGHEASFVSHCESDEEFAKRIDSKLITGLREINIDNIDEMTALGGTALATTLTAASRDIRILGHSRIVNASCLGIYITANGNNLRIRNDLRRRAIICYIDPRCEHPEARRFEFEPVQRIISDRGRYITAAITPLAAYIQAGYPVSVSTVGSFEDWSNLVRGTLAWYGEPDPWETNKKLNEEDKGNSELLSILDAWWDAFQDKELTPRELLTELDMMQPVDGGQSAGSGLKDALLMVAKSGGRGLSEQVDARRLNNWLQGMRGRVAGNKRFVTGGYAHGHIHRWKIEVV